ncbi:hypothetical protein B484DRAFT_402266 [Ochromonadaceae sp. CCMP2298]|nr:hypothetical protein B484DRAFT_402266 [Ochromonadaceae sp. CCMP2298]
MDPVDEQHEKDAGVDSDETAFAGLMSVWRREGKPVSVLCKRLAQLRKWWLSTWSEDVYILCQSTLMLLTMWDKEEEERIASVLTFADLMP